MIQNMKIILLALLTAISSIAVAGDLSNEVRKGTNSPNNTDGNFLELGWGVELGTSPIYGIPEGNTNGKVTASILLDVNSRVQYKGFFMEVFSQSLEQLTLGYNLTNGDRWSLDAVSLQEHSELSRKVSNDLKGLKTRKGDYMFGPRVTGYLDNNIIQLHALTDISDTHFGQVYSAKIGHFWQYKNWNFHGIFGVTYRTRAVADYYLSVQPEDANEKFPEFHAQAGLSEIYELGATYPLSQKWVFRSLIRRVQIDDQWTESPLVVADHGTVFASSISYVF